jgi:TolA-binding protein
MSSCSSNKSCSGATFNNTSNACTLSSGEGSIVSTTGSSAIVQVLLSYSYQLQELNKQLMDINKQMINITKQNYNQIQETTQNSSQQDEQLQNNYNILVQERSQIAEMVREYETINAAYDNGTINVTSSYLKYIGLLFFVIILLFLLLNLSFSNEQRGGGPAKSSNISKYMYLIFLGIVIVFNSSIKKD